MSTKYKATMPNKAYSESTTTVGWIDVFTRLNQKNVIVNSLKYPKRAQLPKPINKYVKLFYILGIVLLFSNFRLESGGKYYLIKINSVDYDFCQYLLCPSDIFSNKKAQSNYHNYDFDDYLVKQYNCKLIVNKPYGDVFYGCCEFKLAYKGIDELKKNGKIDTVILRKYEKLSYRLDADSLLKSAKKHLIVFEEKYKYEISMVELNCDYCTCHTWYYGDNISKNIDSVSILKEIYLIAPVQEQLIDSFINKFGKAK